MAEEEIIEEIIYEDEPSTSKKSNSSKPEKPCKRKKIWWRVLLAWFGGFLTFPIVLAVVALLVVTQVKVDDMVSMTGNDPSVVLGENYRNKNIIEFISELSTADFNTLDGLNKISPLVEKTIKENVNPALKDALGIELNWNEIKNKPFDTKAVDEHGKLKNLTNYLESYIFDNVTIAYFMNDNDEELLKIYQYFLYDVVRDENGEAIKSETGYTINKEKPLTLSNFLDSSFLNDIVNYVAIGDIFDENTDSGFSDAIKNITISNLTEDTLLSLHVIDVLPDIKEGEFLYNFREKTLDELTSLGIDTLKLTEVFDKKDYLGEEKSLIKALYDSNHDITVGEMLEYDTISKIELGDIIAEENYKDEDGNVTNRILDALIKNHATIDNLSSKVEDLKITDVLSISNDAPRVLLTLRDHKNLDGSKGAKLNEIETIMEGLQLRQIIDIDETSEDTAQLLKTLAGCVVFAEGNEGLTYRLNHLKFNEVFKEADLGSSDVIRILWEDNGNGNFEIYDIPDKISKVTLKRLLGDKLYEGEDSDNPIEYTWWFLLTEETEYEDWKIHDPTRISERTSTSLGNGANYTVNDVNKLVANMSYHMETEKLRTLSEAGFIDVDSSVLDSNIVYDKNGDSVIDPYTETFKIGDLTMTEFTNAVATII